MGLWKSTVMFTRGVKGAQPWLKEEDWHYQTPKLSMPGATVSIGVDGTCLRVSEGGFRQAMVGTISLYGADGERQYTTYGAGGCRRTSGFPQGGQWV